MALIKCPECDATVSSAAQACPQCGYPIAAKTAPPATAPVPGIAAPVKSTAPVLELRPSWWRYFWYLVFAWLLIPWLVAWLKRRSTLMRVYADRISLERGLLTKCYREVFIRDIRAVDIDQSLWAKMVGIGNLTISTAATVDAAEQIEGIPNPKQVRDLIIAHRQAS